MANTSNHDIHITGGTIVDGTRVPRYRGDVWIKDGKISQLGGRATSPADTVIDATGKIVAPGFVDLHTHYDAQIRWDPWCTISGYHGVTSVVLGNCGFGFAPVKPDFRDRSMLTMTRTEAIPYDSMKIGMQWDWETIPEYLDSLDRQDKGVNCIQYMPTASLMTYVMGLDKAKTGEIAVDRGTQGDAAPPPRGHGRRAVRLLHPAPRPRLACRPTTTARRWSPTSCTTRTSWPWPRCWPSATRASSRSPRAPATSGPTWPSSRRWPRWPSARSSTTWSPRPARIPRSTAARFAGSRSAGSRACRSTPSAPPAEPASPSPSSTGTSTTPLRPGGRSPPAPRRRRSTRCAIPSSAEALVDEAEEADRRLQVIQAGVGGNPKNLVVQGVNRQADLQQYVGRSVGDIAEAEGKHRDRGDARPLAPGRSQRGVPRPRPGLERRVHGRDDAQPVRHPRACPTAAPTPSSSPAVPTPRTS